MPTASSIKLFISDMDGTAVQYPHGPYQSSWDALGYYSPDWKAWQQAVEKYSINTNLWSEWTRRNGEMMKGIDSKPILGKLLPPPYTSGFKECVAYAKERGMKVGLVSSGLHLIAEHIMQEHALDFQFSNEIHVNGRGIFIGTGSTVVSYDSKGSIIRQLQQRYGVSLDQTLFVGDHRNDIPAWEQAGIKVGMNLKHPDLYDHVDCHFSDFYGLLELLRSS